MIFFPHILTYSIAFVIVIKILARFLSLLEPNEKKEKQMKFKLYIWGFVLIIGLSGSILFFPIQIDQQYCCPSHKLLNHQMPVNSEQSHLHASNHFTPLLDFYLHHYSFFWWSSTLITLTALIFLIKSFHNEQKQNKRSTYALR